MIEKIKFDQTWCEYLTPCPYLNKDKDGNGIFVGDYDCCHCKYQIGINNKERYIFCDYKK